MKITEAKPPQQVSPFQALAESIAAVQTNMTDKIEALQTAVNDGISMVKILITDPTAGVEPRVKTLEKYVTNIKKIPNMETRLTKVEKAVQDATDNLPLQNMVIQGNTPENTILQCSVVKCLEEVEKKSIVHTNTLDMVVAWAGAMQRAQWSVQKQVHFNTSKHHQNDIVVGGIYEYNRQDPCKASIKFFREKMKLTVAEHDIIQAYRTGEPRRYMKNGREIQCPCQMIVHCSPHLRTQVLQNKKVLGGQVDPKGNFTYFVAQYLPEAFKAAQEKYKPDIQEAIKENTKKPPAARVNVKVVGTELSINDSIVQDEISPPDIHQVVHVLTTEDEKISSFDFFESPTHCERSSKFKGFAVWLTKLPSIELAYVKARQQVPNADHIMVAYNIPGHSGSCDDGESFGDLQITKMLKQKKIENVAIYITRVKGDENIGPKRFQII